MRNGWESDFKWCFKSINYLVIINACWGWRPMPDARRINRWLERFVHLLEAGFSGEFIAANRMESKGKWIFCCCWQVCMDKMIMKKQTENKEQQRRLQHVNNNNISFSHSLAARETVWYQWIRLKFGWEQRTLTYCSCFISFNFISHFVSSTTIPKLDGCYTNATMTRFAFNGENILTVRVSKTSKLW